MPKREYVAEQEYLSSNAADSGPIIIGRIGELGATPIAAARVRILRHKLTLN
jgi:hypothetical protein